MTQLSHWPETSYFLRLLVSHSAKSGTQCPVSGDRGLQQFLVEVVLHQVEVSADALQLSVAEVGPWG